MQIHKKYEKGFAKSASSHALGSVVNLYAYPNASTYRTEQNLTNLYNSPERTPVVNYPECISGGFSDLHCFPNSPQNIFHPRHRLHQNRQPIQTALKIPEIGDN